MVFLGQPTNTVGAPAYTWANNTNTGIYLPAASTLGIVTAGADRIRVLSNGNVGIGTTAPQTTLHVQVNTRINGYLSIPALPAFSAYYPSTTSGTIKFISETLSHAAFNKSSGVFTCPVAGIYAFHFDGFVRYRHHFAFHGLVVMHHPDQVALSGVSQESHQARSLGDVSKGLA